MRVDPADATSPASAPAALPDLVVPAALAAILGVTESAACRMIRRGEFGPYARVGRRIVLRRDSVLAAIAAREVRPPARDASSRPTARSPEWTKQMLDRAPRASAVRRTS